jgi:hypothetical protein
MKTHLIQLRLPDELFALLEAKAYLFGLPVTRYILFIILKDLDPNEKTVTRKRILNKRVDD